MTNTSVSEDGPVQVGLNAAGGGATVQPPAKMKAATLRLGAAAVGALAVGALAIGAVAIGRLAVGRMAVGKLALGRARLHHLEIDELVVRHLRAPEPEHGALGHGVVSRIRPPRGWRIRRV